MCEMRPMSMSAAFSTRLCRSNSAVLPKGNAQMPDAITFANVSQTFERPGQPPIKALQDLSFGVGQHQFVSVLGQSGCGKSTLLQLLAGLIKPTSGRIEIDGQSVTGPRDDVGIVFQKPTLLPWFNILGNVTFPIRHKSQPVTSEVTDRAEELLELVGLQDFAKRMPDELSGGMQQRVSIARAPSAGPRHLVDGRAFLGSRRADARRDEL
jgi:NitT/TauT family transport system ATP-binding protein